MHVRACVCVCAHKLNVHTSSALASFSFREAIVSSSYILMGSCSDLPDPVTCKALLLLPFDLRAVRGRDEKHTECTYSK